MKLNNCSRPLCFAFAVLAVVIPIRCGQAQTRETTSIRTHEDLFHALIRAEVGGPAQIQILCATNRHLVTSTLWTWLRNRAAMLATGGDPNQTVRPFRTALQVAQVLQDHGMIATGHLALARKLMELGNLEEAISNLSMSCSHFSQAGLKHDVQFVYSQLSHASFLSQKYANARTYADKSLQLTESLKQEEEPRGAWPEEYGAAIALSVLAHLSLREGRYADAIDKLEEALELFETLDVSLPIFGRHITETLDSLGDAHALIGDYRWALVYLERALTKARVNSFSRQESGVLLRLGSLYLKREDYEKAEDYFSRSFQVASEVSDPRQTSLALLSLGVVALRQDQVDRALPRLRRSLELAQELKDIDSIILARQNLSGVYVAWGKLEKALDEVVLSEELARTSSDLLRTAEVAWWKAEIYRRLGRNNDAIVQAGVSLSIANEHRLDRLSHLALVTLAQAHLAENRPEAAEAILRKALDRLEELRGAIPGDILQQQLFFGKRVFAHHLLIDLLLKANRIGEALTYAERAKARVLLDHLYNGRTSSNAVMTATEKAEEQRLNRELGALGRHLPNDARLSDLATRLKDKRRQYSLFRDVLQTVHPELTLQPIVPSPLEPDNLRQLLPDSRTALLEFVVTDGQLLLFVITRRTKDGEPELRVYPTTIARDDLTRQVTRFQWLISNRHPSFHAEARALYDLLLKPAENQLKGSTSWCIVPDDLLWNVPFQALEPRDLRYLIEDVAISYAPSLSVLDEISWREPRGATSFLAFGNPSPKTKSATAQLNQAKPPLVFESLPEAETEVQTIGNQFGPQRSAVFIGALAKEAVFKAGAANYSVIHFATHGVLDNANPLYSYLALADGDGEDGLLEAREVLEMDLCADLVVLSACETARGRIGAGEGVIGMTWAFLAAGARSAVVSQWAVKSGTSSRQMISFYKHLRAGAGKTEALRQASLEMLRGNQVTHPFYWASFVVMGADR